MDWTALSKALNAEDAARDAELASATHEAKISILRAIAAATTSSASDAAAQTLALAKAFRFLSTPGGWSMYATHDRDHGYDGDREDSGDE